MGYITEYTTSNAEIGTLGHEWLGHNDSGANNGSIYFKIKSSKDITVSYTDHYTGVSFVDIEIPKGFEITGKITNVTVSAVLGGQLLCYFGKKV